MVYEIFPHIAVQYFNASLNTPKPTEDCRWFSIFKITWWRLPRWLCWFQVMVNWLVVSTNPSEKYDRQNGFIFPNFRGEHKRYLSCHHLVMVSWWLVVIYHFRKARFEKEYSILVTCHQSAKQAAEVPSPPKNTSLSPKKQQEQQQQQQQQQQP